MEKVCIYPKQAAEILETTVRSAQRLFRNIRLELNKKKGHYITIPEFALHTGIPEEIIFAQLKKSK